MLPNRRVVVGALLLAVTAVSLALAAPGAGLLGQDPLSHRGSAVSVRPASSTPGLVVVRSTRAGGVVRADSIGLSVETGDFAVPGMTVADGIAPLLRALGPSLLRVGGSTADERPAVVTPVATLRGLLGVLRASGWSVMVTEDLGHYSAAVVQADARRSASVLGARLVGIACGNEPEGFVSSGYRPPGWGLAQLVTEDAACLQAVHAVVPRVPLVGPDSSRAFNMSSWAAALAGKVSMATTHFYPMAHCRVPWVVAPTLLGPRAQQIEVDELAAAVAAAHAHGMTFRVDETNSAACGGLPGVSNSYASALWGADSVFTVLALGAEGLNFHGIVTAAGCGYYSPICLPAGQRTVRAQPLYDGLLLAHEVGLGPLLTVSSPDPSLRVHAVARTGGRTGVLLENESADRVTVQLSVPAGPGAAATTTMTDPGGLAALGGVRLRRGEATAAHVAGGTATYRVTLAPWSAQVLVTPGPRTDVTAAGAGPGPADPRLS